MWLACSMHTGFRARVPNSTACSRPIESSFRRPIPIMLGTSADMGSSRYRNTIWNTMLVSYDRSVLSACIFTLSNSRIFQPMVRNKQNKVQTAFRTTASRRTHSSAMHTDSSHVAEEYWSSTSALCQSSHRKTGARQTKDRRTRCCTRAKIATCLLQIYTDTRSM